VLDFLPKLLVDYCCWVVPYQVAILNWKYWRSLYIWTWECNCLL